MIPMYVVHCARVANPDIKWTQEKAADRVKSWLSGLAAQIRMQGRSSLVLLDNGRMPQDLEDSLLSSFGVDKHPDLLVALKAALATTDTIFGSWGRVSREKHYTILYTCPKSLDSWATERDIKVRTSS